MAHGSPKNLQSAKVSEINEIDPLEELLNQTGCADLHYRVQECIAETKDWRKCQTEVRNFKGCMDIYEKKKYIFEIKKNQDGNT